MYSNDRSTYTPNETPNRPNARTSQRMTERPTNVSQGKPGTKRPATRKASYRPLQYGLVIASFVASFMGATWLQAQDSNLAATESVASVVAEAKSSLAILAPTVTPTSSAQAESAQEAVIDDDDEEETDDVVWPQAMLPSTEAVLPTVTPLPEPTAEPTQVVPTQRVPRSVARSRSSR